MTILQVTKLKYQKSYKVFKFGYSHKVIATSKAKLPAQIHNTNSFIKAEIVHEKIQHLLCKTSLKKAGTVLKLHNDNVKIFNGDMEVTTSNNEYYAIKILPDKACKS